MDRTSLTDVTTTPDSPPEFRALERETANLHRDMKYPAAFAALQKTIFGDLQPWTSELPADRVFELVQALALEMPRWEIAGIEASRFQLEAVAGSWLPGFKMDVVIQVRPEGQGSSVHLRCKSRRGLGSPASSIRAFLRKLEDRA